jgi:8-oxo-dGTP pyrophosphatase MutT (NUDIX family)
VEAIQQKVLIYATSDRGLLVFDEPDFPEVPLQIPGGTVEPGESIFAAAQREFHEEAGLFCASGFRHLGTSDYSFVRDGQSHTQERNCFHLVLPGGLPESWHHHEKTPDGGGNPILFLFRFFWIGLPVARAQLGLGMGEYLNRIDWR